MSIYNLTAFERKIYSQIDKAIDSLKLQVQLPRASAENILLLLNKVISENRNGFLYKPGLVQLTNSITGTVLHMEMCSYAKNMISFCSQIEFEADEIIFAASKEATTYGKILLVYRYFIDHFKYAQSNIESEKYHMTASPFIYREAACDGFSFAYAYIMNRLHIPCGIIMGVSALNGLNGPHSWNIVRLENKYYHVDVTWDICTKRKGSRFVDYLMLDDQMISRDHRWSDYSIPHCTDSSMDFYVREHIICYTESEAIKLLEKQIRTGKEIAGFRYLGRDAEKILVPNSLLKILSMAMLKCGCTYSNVYYDYNICTGTAYFKIAF